MQPLQTSKSVAPFVGALNAAEPAPACPVLRLRERGLTGASRVPRLRAAPLGAMDSPTARRKATTVKKGIDSEEARRRRETHAIRIRKEKQAEQVAKHRKVRPRAWLGAIGSATPWHKLVM